MPDVSTLTTEQLLSQIGSGVLNSSQQAALDEINNNRIVIKNDSDDVVISGTEVNRGGVRPQHHPLI